MGREVSGLAGNAARIPGPSRGCRFDGLSVGGPLGRVTRDIAPQAAERHFCRSLFFPLSFLFLFLSSYNFFVAATRDFLPFLAVNATLSPPQKSVASLGNFHALVGKPTLVEDAVNIKTIMESQAGYPTALSQRHPGGAG